MPVAASQDRAILTLVGEVMGSLDRDDFARSLVRAVRAVVPSEWASLNGIGPNPDDTWVLLDPGPPPQELVPAFQRYAHQNPLIDYYMRTQDGRAYRISDFMQAAEFHELDLYREVYAHMGVEAQMAFCLPSERGHVLGVALSRRTPYTDEERDLLNEARPFLIQAYRNAIEFETLKAAARQPSSAPSEADLVDAGLTRREREVLRLVATGLSNQSAADELGVSVRTVQKHLERGFRKLGLRSRTEAAVRLAGGAVVPATVVLSDPPPGARGADPDAAF
jgi:DNA-binding CsgD family transcriptional regulator